MPLNSNLPNRPPLRRRSMAYRAHDPAAHLFGEDPISRSWKKVAFRRRLTLGMLTVLSGGLCGMLLNYLLTSNKMTVWQVQIVAIYTILSSWIAANFWIAVFGLWVLRRGGDAFDVSRELESDAVNITDDAKTCIVIPVYNEDPAVVFAGLKAVYHSIERTGRLSNFDFFILSDSADPDHWVAEEAAWSHLVAELGGQNVRVHYRRRRNRTQKKSGNIADFCRRWGSQYRYMIVLDADSLMSGDLAVKLVRIMEARPDIGILQTVPQACNQHSLIARAQQFAMHVYGPLFIAGFHFWQLGDGGFWGHNAIIRMEPYMRFCALPKLAGSPPFGGEVLSHDFVEAALLRRSGLGVWIAHDLEGSYEQMPPNLITELDRDRRWFQGNIQHLRFLFMRGTSFGYRVLFLIGNLFYFCSFLWLASLVTATLSLIEGRITPPDYFPEPHMLHPEWPIYHTPVAVALTIMTALFLFGPKMLAVMRIIIHRKARSYGGALKLATSTLLEILLSLMLAPIRMIFHSYYVFLTLFGRKLDWKAPPRSERRTKLVEALRIHGPSTAVALFWGVLLYFVDRNFFGWALLFLVPLLLSVLLSMWTSRADAGRAFQKAKLFLIPEELDAPREVVDFQKELKSFAPFSSTGKHVKFGFAQAVFSPQFVALHRALTRPRHRPNLRPGIIKDREALIEKVLAKGTRGLSRKERIRLLTDADTFARLHEKLRMFRSGDTAEFGPAHQKSAADASA